MMEALLAECTELFADSANVKRRARDGSLRARRSRGGQRVSPCRRGSLIVVGAHADASLDRMRGASAIAMGQ